MSYVEDRRIPYRAQCACGEGFLRYYKTSNGWGYDTSVELKCAHCQRKYRYEKYNGIDFLIPKELHFPSDKPVLPASYCYTQDERFILKNGKSIIEAIIADMTAPKHRYIKDLENNDAISFAQEWVRRSGKKSLKPMIDWLQATLQNYACLMESCNKKKKFQNEYKQKFDKFQISKKEIASKCFRLQFEHDVEEQKLIDDENKKKKEEYESAHRYDGFQASVSYDPLYRYDLTGRYWDSFFIEECIDPQHFELSEDGWTSSRMLLITKLYRCVCTICGNEEVIPSSSFKILSNDMLGYYPEIHCDCHTVSSFEAKAMKILNELGITYKREASFEGLTGDEESLRFDFALYKSSEILENSTVDLIIELQGPHHSKAGYYDEYGLFVEDSSERGKRNFERQKNYDEKKMSFCIQHEIKLERIGYTYGRSYEILKEKIIRILSKHNFPIK